MLIIFLLTFTLVLAANSYAQDDDPNLGLSEDDYALLEEAISNTDSADSFQITYSGSLSINDTTTGDQTLDVAGSGAIIRDEEFPSLSITSSGTSSNLGDLPTSFNREVRLVEGVGYNNLIDVTTGGVGWQGQEVTGPFNGAYNLARILVDPSALTSVDLLDIVNLADGLNALDLRPYVMVTRGEDITEKGETLAHFTATLDTSRLFESPEFARKLIEILAAAGQDPGIPDDQMAAAGILIGSMFRGSSLTVDLYVNEEDYLTEANADLVLAVDASLLTGEGSPINMNLALDFSLSGFDGDYTVEAPTDVVVVKPDTNPTPAPVDGQTIAAGTPFVVDLDGTTDLFYNAANPETVTITARSLDGSLDTTLDVLDASGNVLESNDDATVALPNLGLTDSAIQNLALPAEGLYTIRIGTFSGGGAGQVEVLVSSSAGQVVSSNLTGKVMFVAEPIKIYLTGQDAVDLVYEVLSSETISLYAQSLDSNPLPVDSTLEILDSDGEQIAFNDDLNSESTNPGIENLALEAGIYTIRLDSYDDTQVGGVSVELLTGGVEVTRDGGEGTTGESESIALGDTLSGTITDSSTSEYSFTGEAGQVVTITAVAIDPDSSEQDLYLTLYNSEGDEIASDDDSGESIGLGQFDPAIIGFELSSDDDYRIVVDSIFDISGEYEITLSEG